MDLAKNKYGIAFLLIVAVAAIHYFFFYEKCKQPDEMSVLMLQLQCAQSLDIPSLRAELCQQQYGNPVCELQETDRDAGSKLFLGKVNACARAELKRTNMCTDKYEDIR
jgi:hypothetical protein